MWRLKCVMVPFGKIKDVLVDTMVGDYNSQLTSCRLTLSTDDGEVPLSSTYQPDFERFNEMRNTLLGAVLGKESVPPLADPVRALVDAGRREEAVSLLRRRDGLSLEEAMNRISLLTSDTALS
jgi:hypothetical protein